MFCSKAVAKGAVAEPASSTYRCGYDDASSATFCCARFNTPYRCMLRGAVDFCAVNDGSSGCIGNVMAVVFKALWGCRLRW